MEVDRDQNSGWIILQDGFELVNSSGAEPDTESMGVFKESNLGMGLAEVTPAETAASTLSDGSYFESYVVKAASSGQEVYTAR